MNMQLGHYFHLCRWKNVELGLFFSFVWVKKNHRAGNFFSKRIRQTLRLLESSECSIFNFSRSKHSLFSLNFFLIPIFVVFPLAVMERRHSILVNTYSADIKKSLYLQVHKEGNYAFDSGTTFKRNVAIWQPLEIRMPALEKANPM